MLLAKRRVEYRELPARSYITRLDSPRLPFHWTINPYRGCEFGCRYCYARYTHEFMELHDSEQFETRIFAKQFHASAFAAELRRIPLAETIAIGTATDPYQPAERRYRVTRRMLEVLARTSGFRLGITTKSDLVVRDLDLLREVSQRHRLTVSVTITTVDPALARLLEPGAPRPDLRFSAVGRLSKAGLDTRVSCAPILPSINDSETQLEELAAQAARAGARGMWGAVVFLKPCASAVFLPFLEGHFPHLVQRYRERFERSAYLRGAYPEMIRGRLDRIRRRHGLDRFQEGDAPPLWPAGEQLPLFA
jgi:DNA repair photolyase